jgi:hypothetical protein
MPVESLKATCSLPDCARDNTPAAMVGGGVEQDRARFLFDAARAR